MQSRAPVLIVGAGPAGASAAQVLARAGVQVILLDKAAFPRDKLCGGLLTERAEKAYRQVFTRPWDEVIDHLSSGARFFAQQRPLRQVASDTRLWFTRRHAFDAFLVRQAVAAGADLIQGDALTDLDLDNRLARLRSGRVIAYSHLVGADGVNSLVAKTLFGRAFDPDQVAFALEMEVDRQTHGVEVTEPEIHFGEVRWGYAWVFPKKDTLTVGVGGLHGRNPDLKATFRRFLLERFGQMPEGRIKGHHLPFGDYRPIPGQGQVLLAGDAAGLVEPITGEGIAFALQSGAMAGAAILESLRHGGPALPRYQRDYAAIARDFRHANRLRWLIFPRWSERLLIRALPRSQTLPRLHLELMADRIAYADYSRAILGRLLRKLLLPGRSSGGK